MRKSGAYWRRMTIMFLVVGLAALFQVSPVFELDGLRPNLVLAALVAFSFFLRESVAYLTAVFLALIVLRFRPEAELTALAMTLVAIAAFFAHNLIPGKPFINNIIIVALGTPLFYLIAESSFLLSGTITVLQEMVYNVFMGAVFFLIAHRLLGYEEELRITV